MITAGDVVTLIILAFFIVLAGRKVIADRRNGVPNCGYVCGDEVCRGRCGHINTSHMSRQTKREVKQAIKDLKARQKANAKG